MVKKTLERLYIILIFIFLYAPIVILMVLSFNKSKTRSKWGGFTLKWYQSLFENDAIMQAFYTTIILAVLASLIATVLGTAAALGMSAMGKRTKSLMMGITNIPMLNADIVTAIALMLLFIKFSSMGLMEFGFGTVLLSHITFCLPYVVLCVMPKLAQMDQHIYEAALDLGASPVYAFFKVVLPDIFPGVLTGFLMSFTMSLDDFVITHFTKGAGVDTISTKVYTEVRKGIKPEMYALSTLLFVTVLILLLLVNHRSAKQEKKNA